jgi:molecular chaperone HscA
MVAGAARVRVSFQVDADGLLNVTAREETSGVEAAISVKPSYGLPDDEIARMLRESFGTAEQDMIERSVRESQVEAERMALATRSALAADGDLLSDAERDKVDALLTALQASRESSDHHAINAAVEALAKGTEAFAAERMNRSIRKALAGKRVDQV